jgi:LysR family positive regulator for ilvC
MNQRELQLFLHLSKSLSFARTSAACHVTPSSLSRIIQRLEAEAGAALFNRDNRSVRLTDAGQAFRRFADETVSNWLALKAELEEKKDNLSGELSLFCSVTASYSFLFELLNDFRKSHPGIEIKLRTGDTAATLDRVQNEMEDVGIAALPEKPPVQLATQVMARTPLVFIAPTVQPQFSLPDPVNGRIADWRNLPLVLSESGLARERADRWFRENGIKPNIYAQVSGNEAIVSMVSLGFGIGLVPQLVAEHSPMAGAVRVLPVKHDMHDFEIGTCVLKRKLNNPLIRAFWDTASRSLGDEKRLY